MFNHEHHHHHGPRAMLFDLPLGSVGDGPYSVWIEHNDFRTPDSFGFATADEAFARAAELREGHAKKAEAIKVIIGDQLPEELKKDLDAAVIPEFVVYRMDKVSRVDVSTLPPL